MQLSFRNWTNVVPAVKETIARFPLPIICTLCATFALMLLIHRLYPVDKVTIGKFTAVMAYGVVALTSLKLFVESKNRSLVFHTVGATAIMAVITLFVWRMLDDRVSVTYFLFSVAVGLSLLFAPYIKRSSDAPSVWYFNYQTGVAVFFAGIAAGILGTGISLSLVSVGYLFEIHIPDTLFGDVWTLCMGVFFPIYVLANISREFDFEGESCRFPKGVSFITNYIMVPLMFGYMAILYVYFLKIIVQGELPRGNLGWMISTFGTIGITTKLLVYPIRQSGTRLLVLFDKYYYYALIVPIILLSIAIGVRIHAYGMTEDRYTVVLLGTWFAIVILATFIKKDRFHIKHVPMILAFMAFLASFGPWGAVEVSIYSQVSRFEALLAKNKLLVNGQAVKATEEVPFADRKSMSSIADYLIVNEKRLKRIRPWFEALQNDKAKIISNRWGGGNQIIELLGLGYVNRWESESENKNGHFSYDVKSGFKRISGFDFVENDSIYSCGNTGCENTLDLYRNGKKEHVVVRCAKNSIMVRTDSGEEVTLELDDIIQKLRERDYPNSTPVNQDEVTLTQTSKSGHLKVGLVLSNVYGDLKTKDEIQINGLSYVLMLKFIE